MGYSWWIVCGRVSVAITNGASLNEQNVAENPGRLEEAARSGTFSL
jgi:hypothetical protein